MQGYLGDDTAARILDRYANLTGRVDERLLERSHRHFELRELSGIRQCIETGDDEELADEVRKLRAGPVLS